MSKVPEFPLLTTPLFYCVQVISWLLSLALTIATVGFILYQLKALYVPFWLSKISGTSFRFPEYFYRVYGDEVNNLGSEQYGYLFSACLASLMSCLFVLPEHPFKKELVSDFRRDVTGTCQAVNFRLRRLTGFMKDEKLE
jgi:hypothetical protein